MNQTMALSLIGLALCGVLILSVGRRIGHLELWCGVAACAAAAVFLVVVEPRDANGSVSSAMVGASGIFSYGFGKGMSKPLANYVRRLIARWREARAGLLPPDSQR